jgi:hypothetical protein
MKKILLTLLFLPFLAFGNPISDHLQEASVTIISNGGEGSGVIFTRGGKQYVWTAGHVVAHNRHVSKQGVTTFDDVSVVRPIVEHGELIGLTLVHAAIIKFSNPDKGRDLALLKLTDGVLPASSVQFYLGQAIPPNGTPLFHVGSLEGFSEGANSLTTGIMSFVGRPYQNILYDQVSVTAFPGSSGGGVFLQEDGRYIGMLVRGSGETFNLIVPVREMIRWSKENGVYWALDDRAPVTPISQIENPIEVVEESKAIIDKLLHGKFSQVFHTQDVH